MTMKLRDGDYIPDGAGGFAVASGTQALLERVLFKLMARRGAFPLMPELGSQLYRLTQRKPAEVGTLAKEYAEEALADEAELELREVQWNEDTASLTLDLDWQGESLSLSLTL